MQNLWDPQGFLSANPSPDRRPHCPWKRIHKGSLPGEELWNTTRRPTATRTLTVVPPFCFTEESTSIKKKETRSLISIFSSWISVKGTKHVHLLMFIPWTNLGFNGFSGGAVADWPHWAYPLRNFGIVGLGAMTWGPNLLGFRCFFDISQSY